MAPREQPKVQRAIAKPNITKKTPSTSRTSDKNTMTTTKKNTEKTNVSNNITTSRLKTNAVPSTPKSKGNSTITVPETVTKSGKKLWKRRPKPAHSGVPIPEKMKRLEKLLKEADCSF